MLKLKSTIGILLGWYRIGWFRRMGITCIMDQSYPYSAVLIRWRAIYLFQNTSATIWVLVQGNTCWSWCMMRNGFGAGCVEQRKGLWGTWDWWADYACLPQESCQQDVGHCNYCFFSKDNIENGGKAMKLGFSRAQSHKIADEEQQKGVWQPNGKMKFVVEILRRKEDPYLVDCCVTGSNEGMADDPKFPLKKLLQEYISPIWLQD